MSNNNFDDGEQTNGNAQVASWIEADSPQNPFGVRLVNLMGNLNLQSFTEDQKTAACSVSWRPGHQSRLEVKRIGDGIPCDLRYPAASLFPDGLIFIPRVMEDKWVIAWRNETVLFARSWSGETMITADAVFETGELRLSRLYAKDDSVSGLGDLVTVVDWMMRSHAMEERLALPVDQETAELLIGAPLIAMNAFGHRLFCAGVDYTMPPPNGQLYSLGDLSAAVYENDADAIRKLASDEAWKTPVAAGDSPPLVLASQLGHTDLCRLMIELGADIEAKNGRGGTALQMGVVGKCSTTHVKMLIDAGANIEAANHDGFTAAHAAAEIDHPELVTFLHSLGANLEAETNAGYRPIHIAAGLGHQAVAEALLKCKVDFEVPGNGKSPLQIAKAQGKDEFAKWFAKATATR